MFQAFSSFTAQSWEWFSSKATIVFLQKPCKRFANLTLTSSFGRVFFWSHWNFAISIFSDRKGGINEGYLLLLDQEEGQSVVANAELKEVDAQVVMYRIEWSGKIWSRCLIRECERKWEWKRIGTMEWREKGRSMERADPALLRDRGSEKNLLLEVREI